MKHTASLFVLAALMSGTTLADEIAAEPGKANSVCKYIAETAYAVNKDLVADNLGPLDAPFVREYLVQSLTWDTDGDGENDLGEADFPPGELDPYLEDAIYSATRWGEGVGKLPYNGIFYSISAGVEHTASRSTGWGTGAFVTAVNAPNHDLACAFDNNVHETSTLTPFGFDKLFGPRGMDCQGLIADQDALAVPDIEVSTEQWDRLREKIGGRRAGDYYQWAPFDHETMTRGPSGLRIDVNADGELETLVWVNFSSGTGCDYVYYDLVKDDFSGLGDPDLRAQMVAVQGGEFFDNKPSVRCDHYVNIRQDGDHVFFEKSGFRQVPDADGVTLMDRGRSDILRREIRVLVDGEAEQVCRSTFSVEPVIVLDRFTGLGVELAEPE